MRKIPPITGIEQIKALAILGVVTVHMQAALFDRRPWVLLASRDLPNLWSHPDVMFPAHDSYFLSVLHFFTMLGANAPGVFLVVSGLTLTWSTLHTSGEKAWLRHYFMRRVLRIFPLYMAAHVLDLVASRLIPGQRIPLEFPQIILSLFGLRFTYDTFLYLDPAWWFVWVILQLYCLFPILFWLLQTVGISRFLTCTFVLTVMSRIWGIVAVEHLSSWDLGIICITRLGEFTIGMAIARWLYDRKLDLSSVSPASIRVITGWALIVYLIGLAAQTTLMGTTVAPLFVSLGMTGVFWGICKLAILESKSTSHVLTWIGIHSYGIYLLHFLPFKWMVAINRGAPVAQILSMLGVVAIAGLLTWFMERTLRQFTSLPRWSGLRPTPFT